MGYVLFSRPKHDDTLNYLHYYSGLLIDLPEKYGFKLINKEFRDVTQKIICSIIEKQKPCLIMFNGHGSPTEILGHNNEVLISNDINPNILSGTITYALACSSADKLGDEAIKKGALAFVGYDDEFALGRDPDSEATPRRDRIAKLFLEPSNLLFSSLIKGNSVGDAVNRAKKKIMENIWFLNTTNEFPEAPHYAPFLFNNLFCLKICGDSTVSV